MQHPLHWRDAALIKSEGITDAWEVTKTYAGRLAEWILFLCMVANIIEILPGVSLSGWLTNTILGVQAVTLDIAGFGLASMAQQALASGETEAARKAKDTAYWLIALMMITVLSVSIGTLWPTAKTYTDIADKVLILIRVAATVWYGHVLHDLRQHTRPMVFIPELEAQLANLSQQVTTMQQALTSQRINYAVLAQQIAPLLPAPEVPNYALLADQMMTQVLHLMSEKEQHMISALTALQAELHEVTVAAKEQQEEQQKSDEESNIVDIADYQEMETEVQQEEQQPKQQRASQVSTNGATNAKQKAQRILKRTPDISASDLAKKVGVSRQYASKIIAESAS